MMPESMTLQDYEALCWLAAREVVYFSTYNRDIGTYDDGWYVYINANDTFCYACADGEYVAPSQATQVRALYEKYGSAGVVAWVSQKRGKEPLPHLRDPAFEAALAEVKALSTQQKEDL